MQIQPKWWCLCHNMCVARVNYISNSAQNWTKGETENATASIRFHVAFVRFSRTTLKWFIIALHYRLLFTHSIHLSFCCFDALFPFCSIVVVVLVFVDCEVTSCDSCQSGIQCGALNASSSVDCQLPTCASAILTNRFDCCRVCIQSGITFFVSIFSTQLPDRKMVNAAKGSKVKQRPIKKGKKAAAKKQQLKKPVEEVEVPLPATRKSDDPIPKKVMLAWRCSRGLRWTHHQIIFNHCRKNGLTGSECWCLPHAASIIGIGIWCAICAH